MDRIIKASGEVIETKPQNGTDYSLEELQAIVGGYIECLWSVDGKETMVLNEEGKLEGLDCNDKATEWFVENYGNHDYVVGDVLICDSEHIK